ncbi:zinc-ribbon domain-containing protein [Ruminococcus sp.]|uniref:zinc-ribbon domain-containing protein n=1 Tax=Ruminococcus sp. TaxID=41978 RepID=UPI003FA73EEF
MICKECGNKIDDNSTFCKFCGYKVSAESSCQKAYLNTPTENSSAIKSKQVKKKYYNITILYYNCINCYSFDNSYY